MATDIAFERGLDLKDYCVVSGGGSVRGNDGGGVDVGGFVVSGVDVVVAAVVFVVGGGWMVFG